MAATQAPTLQSQSAVWKRFKADSTLMGMVKNIWDGVPENSPLPYIAFGDHIESPWPTFGHDNADIEFILHIFAEGPGDEETWLIYSEVQRLLRWDWPLDLNDYFMAKMALQAANILTDEDGITRHMVIRYRFLEEEK